MLIASLKAVYLPAVALKCLWFMGYSWNSSRKGLE